MTIFALFFFEVAPAIRKLSSLKPFITFMLLGLFVTNSSLAALMPAAPQLSASSYLLVDASSGKVIVEHNADKQVPPASLTKIMTAFIVSSELEKGSITAEDRVPISVKAWKMGGSRMFIKEGTDVLLEDLLRGVIIQSGNDASVALAEYIAGDETTFADMMNQQAYALDMRNTHFNNATGWPSKGHLSSARDMSLLANALVNEFPEHYSFYSEKEFTYNDITQSNRNGLLWRDQYVDGIKTGHTDEAGYCLVSSAKKGDMRLISVVMGAKSSRGREQETQKLLAYGFRYYQTHTLYQAGESINSARVWGGAEKEFNLVLEKSLTVTIPRGQKEQLNVVIEVDRELVAPINKAKIYGVLKLSLEGELLATRNLVAANDVEPAGIFSRLFDWLTLLVRGLLGLAS